MRSESSIGQQAQGSSNKGSRKEKTRIEDRSPVRKESSRGSRSMEIVASQLMEASSTKEALPRGNQGEQQGMEIATKVAEKALARRP